VISIYVGDPGTYADGRHTGFRPLEIVDVQVVANRALMWRLTRCSGTNSCDSPPQVVEGNSPALEGSRHR